jgi:hypothetical protein
MNNIKFFSIAIVAIKIKTSPKQPGNINADVGLYAWVVLARSNEDARKMGVNMAIEKWPENEGWTGHEASVCEVTQDALSHALDRVSAEDDDASDEIEQIM